MGKELFKKLAALARLKKKDLKKPDKTPRSFDRKPISFDGRLDLGITFDGEMVNTPVHLKMDSAEELLLSEGMCRQFQIIRYHSDVICEKNAVKKSSSDCVVPLIRVRLTQSGRILPNQRRMIAVELEEATAGEVIIECDLDFEKMNGVQVEDSLVHVSSNGAAEIFIVNTSGFTCARPEGEIVG